MCNSALSWSCKSFHHHRENSGYQNTRLRMNFLKDIFKDAFENDKNLSPDRSKQQLDNIDDFNDGAYGMLNQKTEVQKRYLSLEKKSKFIGAPMNSDLLINTKWKLSLYLTGVPNFDPNNSLYGSRVNISQRKQSNLAQAGLAIGADSLPENPTVELSITLLPEGLVDVEESSFTYPTQGNWLLSDDGRNIRFSLQVTGYQRTVTTKGTIQNVYWTDRDTAERKSSAIYSIPAGVIIAETSIDYGSQPGIYVMGKGGIQGVLKVERAMGMFGVTSKLFACGMFSAEMITDSKS